MRLETPRLFLRQPMQADIAALSPLWRDEHVQQFMGGVISQDAAEARIAGILQDWEEHGFGLWAVCEKGKSQLMGLCGLGHFKAEGGSEIEVVYKLFPSFWGQGFATEAAQASLAYGFQTLGFDRIIGVTQEANLASQRVLEKLGMRHIRNFWMWEAPQRFYELTRTDWFTRVEA